MSKDGISSPLPQLGQNSQKQVHYLPGLGGPCFTPKGSAPPPSPKPVMGN